MRKKQLAAAVNYDIDPSGKKNRIPLHAVRATFRMAHADVCNITSNDI